MSSSKKKISDELEEREKTCNDIIKYEYERPLKNPYEYDDFDSFQKENPFDKTTNCKVLIPDNEEEIITDKYNRYYKDIYTPARCKTANGFWVGSTVNRNNNYEKGNCWKDEEDAECGGLLNNYKLIRKKDYQDGNVSREEIKSARSKCEVNPKCYFKRISEFKRDCVSRKRITFDETETSNKKPKTESDKSNIYNLIDIDNIEKSLEEFYSGINAPKTVELIGKGNRCVDNYINSVSSQSKSKSKSKDKKEIFVDTDIIDENLESKMDYLNDVIKLEHLYEKITLEEFEFKYLNYFKEYIQYLLINLDPNDKDNEDIFMLYIEDITSKNFKKFIDDYNNYIKVLKEIFNVGYKLNIPNGENKYYYKYVSLLYNKYFPRYFDSYIEDDKNLIKNYKIMHILFIRYLILSLNPNKNEDFLKLYMYDKSKSKYSNFLKLYNEGLLFEYSEYFPDYFNLDIDVYINRIKKNYYIYSRYIISKTDPLKEENQERLLYFVNNRDPELLKEFIEEYKKFNIGTAEPFSYYEMYHTYFTNFYQYSLDLDFIYYIKNKIYQLDPNFKIDYDELEKYISEPKLMKEFKINYNLISKNANYDSELLKLHKKYFPDYFKNIEEKYKLSSSSYASSSSTPVISSVSSASSIKPPKLPTVPQSIINNICKTIHHKKLDKRGMLIWHSTGSGKTCTATAIMEGFWGTDMDIIYCSKIEALTSNPPPTFYKCASDLFPRFAGKSITEMEKEFKNIRFLSFAKLANRIENKTINLNNCILIIDEVHNLFRPLPNQKKQHQYLEKLLLNDSKYPKLKVFILTATLGDNPDEIMKLLNIVKNNNVPKIEYDDIFNEDLFKQKIRGLISYFDMSSDRSKFPLVIDNEPRYINMSNKQFEAYIEKYKEVKESHKDYNKLAEANSLNKYWMAARKYSNMLYNFEKGTTLDIFSPKLKELIENVSKYPDEKQYVYSAFYENRGYGGQGILAVALELKKKGYEQLTPDEAKKIYQNPTDSNKKLRFILAITTQLGDDKGKALSEMVNLYNAPFNKNGEFVHLILASQSFNEGLDLKGVRHIHIFEPLITWASDKQTIGRAARNCSHSDLRLKDWTVNIHRYISNFPEEIAKDEGKLLELKKLLEDKSSILDTYAIDLKDEQTKLKNAKAKITKLTKDKKKSKDEIKMEGDKLKEEIDIYTSKINEIKENISTVKNEIKEINKELKNYDDENVEEGKGKGKGKKKKGIKLDAKGVENIDKFIYRQAVEKMKDILSLYQMMQESAVDCLILNDFHKKGNKTINCTKY
jgi:hypothetical protein